MPIFYTPDRKLLAWYDKSSIANYRSTISLELLKNFGKGPFSTSEVTEALFFTLDWYAKTFLDILRNENDLCFYQGIFMLHEFSCEFHRNKPNCSPIPQMNDQDFAMYRRILKLCLEQACDIQLNGNELLTTQYLKSKEEKIDDLLYLGDYIFECSNLLAEQHLIEDCVDLLFTKDDLYYFDHKHHYGYIIDETVKTFSSHLEKAVTGKDDFKEFVKAAKNCLGVEYDKAVATIQLIHEEFKKQGGKLVLDEWFIYPKNLEQLFGIPFEKGERFFKGLTLSKDNKMPLKDAVYRPHNLNKYLYRPFLIWNVDGKDLTIVGDGIFIESISSLCTNAFGWNKYPPEWGNQCFQEFVSEKVRKNDKILEDAIEQILKSNSIIYDRNITSLKKWNNQNVNIENKECGEIDFLFIYDNKFFIADSKHQIARYDMNNFKNDYASFDTNKKSYNKTLKRKVSYLEQRTVDIEEHFQVILNDKNFKLNASDMEGVFIVNTPTFIMYNNEFRIYTLKSFEELVTGEYVDQVFQLIIEVDDSEKFLFVKYPYFKKPTYVVFDSQDDEETE